MRGWVFSTCVWQSDNSILRGYRCSLPPQTRQTHAKEESVECWMRKGQIRAGCGWLSFSVWLKGVWTVSRFRKNLDGNEAKWHLFAFLEAACAWLQRCHVDLEEKKQQNMSEERFQRLLLFGFNQREEAWWRVSGLKGFSRAADCSKQQSSGGHWCSPAITLKNKQAGPKLEAILWASRLLKN